MYLADIMRKSRSKLFMFFLSSYQGRDIFVCSVTKDLVDEGLSAKKFVSSFGEELGLKGGGRDDLVKGVAENFGGDFSDKVKKMFGKFVKK